MEHFVRVIFEKDTSLTEGLMTQLDESVFPNSVMLETTAGASVIHIPLAAELSEQAADEYAETISNYLFDQGLDDFDIEISTSKGEPPLEETYDGDDFYLEYGVLWYNEQLDEAEYQGRTVKLGKPVRSKNGPKKFHVYVKDPSTGNIKKVNFGDPDMEIKRDNPARKRSFRARHNCDNPGPKTKARYWSCRAW
jgi:hypothetical protein